MSYSIAEVRKAIIAAATLGATALGAVLANDFAREHLPPQVVLVCGSILTVLAVFGIGNAPPAKVVDAAEAAVGAVKEVQHLPELAQDLLPPIVSEKIESAIGAVEFVNDMLGKYTGKKT